MRLRVVALALLVVGLALMIPFEAWYTRVAGVICLLGFVVCGTFAVATPEYLATGEGADEGEVDSGAATPRA